MTGPPSGERRAHRIRGRDPVRNAGQGRWRRVPIAVLAVAAALLAWAGIRQPEPPPGPPPPTELPLARSDLTCPAVGAAKLPAARAGIGITHLGGADDSGGDIAMRTLGRGGKPPALKSPPKPGDWSVLTEPADASAIVVISATDAMAVGAAAFVATVADDGAGGGLAVTPCPAPTREAWFVGAGSTVDHTSTLLITNPGDTQAVVDVSLLTSDGDNPSNTNVMLPPHGEQRLNLADLAAGRGDVVVEVAAEQGQLVAALLDYWTATLAPAGTEWIPAARPPSTDVTVGPVLADSGRRALIVGNPGDRTASVDIQVVGPDGTSPVEGFDSASVPPGSVETVRMPASLADQVFSVRLESDQPIVGSVRSVSKGNPADLAYGTSAPELDASAVVPVDLPTVDPAGVGVCLTSANPNVAAKASIEAHAAGGRSLAQTTVTVPAGATVTWQAGRHRDLKTDAEKVAYLVVTPTQGHLVGDAFYETGGSGRAAFPLQSAATVVVAPGVYPLG